MRIAFGFAALCMVSAITLDKKSKQDGDMAMEMASAAAGDGLGDSVMTSAMAIVKAERHKAALEKEEAMETAKDAMQRVFADAGAKKEEEDAAD